MLRELVRALIEPLPTCRRCHWHVDSRGWQCCNCGTEVGGNQAPPPQPVDVECGQPLGAFDALEKWLDDMAGMEHEPIRPAEGIRRRLRLGA